MRGRKPKPLHLKLVTGRKLGRKSQKTPMPPPALPEPLEDPASQGLLIRAGNGTLIPNPLVAIANRACADALRFATEFGMTPSSRSRIDVGAQLLVADDPAARFFDPA
jgi:phage terminase small subunit